MTRISLTIPLEMSAIPESLTAAVANGSLLQSAQSNIVALLNGTTSEIAPLAVQELVDAGAWEELNVFFLAEK